MNKLNENRMFDMLRIVLFGFIIGIAAIIPGLSGGVLAISLGIYPKIVESISGLRTKFKESIMFLLPYAIGVGIGMVVFGVVMKPLLENYERSVIWLFMGLILGSIPTLVKEATEKGFRILYLLPMIVAFAAGIFFATSTENLNSTESTSEMMLFLGGGILAIGAIVPGMSSSFILMQLGVYDKIISSFVAFDIYSIFWITAGASVFFFAMAKLIHLAFEKFHSFAYFAALGFLLSCIFAVYPGIKSVWDIILLVAGITTVSLFEKLTKK